MATLQELKQKANDPRLQPLIGKSVLFGAWQYFEDELVEHSQGFGHIARFDGGILIQTVDDEFFFPVSYEALVPAPRGKYKLKTTGKKIVNPDYLLSWRVDLEDDLPASQWEANTAPHHYSIVEKEWDFEGSSDDEYLKALIERYAAEMIGKILLVGIRFYTQVNRQEKFQSQTQKYGRIVQISYGAGVVIELQDGTNFTLPPDISNIERAPAGEYRLESSGEIIVDPDYMTEWRVIQGKQGPSSPHRDQ